MERTRTQLTKTLKMPTNENTTKSQEGKIEGEHCPLDLRGRQGEHLGNTSSLATKPQIYMIFQNLHRSRALNDLVYPQCISVQIQGFFP